jgi:Mce-associated membrane protein
VPAQSTVDDELSTKAQSDADSDTGDDDAESPSPQSGRVPGFRLALIVGLVTILALAALAGWFGYGVYQTHQTDKMRSLYLAVARQGALNLTTINYTEADADIQRILDSSTGQFYDDFSKRAPAFVEVVKQAQAKTDGSIVEAGLESFNGDSARVLVAVRVTTSNKGVTDAQPRHWRMRIDVQKVAQTVKVANVGFVP